MAHIYADRVKETTTTTGTGQLTLAGAVVGFQDFDAALDDGDTCYYTITDGIDWEVGLGTFVASGTKLTRTSVIDSSNGAAAVNWGAGTKEVFITHPAIITQYTVLQTAGSTDNAVARYDGASGLILQDSPVIIDDSGNISGVGNINGVAAATAQFVTAQATKLGHITVTQAVDLDTIESTLASHVANTSNPHSVTKAQVGLGNADNTSDATKQAATLLAAFPVGSIYINTSNTNPGTFIGGTWVAFGAGRVPVGFDSGQTEFDTDEETGGAKEVTLTSAQSGLVAHNHTQNSHNHTQDAHSHSLSFSFTQNDGASNTDPGSIDVGANTNRYSAAPQGSGVANTTATNQATTATNNAVAAADAASAHTNLQPYIVVRMWKRTA